VEGSCERGNEPSGSLKLLRISALDPRETVLPYRHPLVRHASRQTSRVGKKKYNLGEVDFLNSPNPSGRTGPGVDSASNRNEYQESLKNKETWG
jgi:hypothetical protein